MQTIKTIGLDIAKSVFQVHGVDADGGLVVRRQLKRRYVLLSFGSTFSTRAMTCSVSSVAEILRARSAAAVSLVVR